MLHNQFIEKRYFFILKGGDNGMIKKRIKRDYALKHVDMLIENLSMMCKHAKKVKCPGLVGFNQALKNTKNLRKVLNKKKFVFSPRQWSSLIDSAVFMILLVRKIYSLFFNCKLNKIIIYEIWKNYTAITYCRGNIAI